MKPCELVNNCDSEKPQWVHRPWWKVAINTVLRAFQPQLRKWLVYSVTDDSTTPPTVLGYGFGPIMHKW